MTVTPCWFCGSDSRGGLVGHISEKPEETGIVAYCGDCEPVTEQTRAIVSPQVFEVLMNKVEEQHGD